MAKSRKLGLRTLRHASLKQARECAAPRYVVWVCGLRRSVLRERCALIKQKKQKRETSNIPQDKQTIDYLKLHQQQP